MSARVFYKATRPDGTDLHSGKVNYRDALGGVVAASDEGPPRLCSATVLHAVDEPRKVLAFLGRREEFALFRVSGDPVVSDSTKFGFTKLRVLKEYTPRGMARLLGLPFGPKAEPPRPIKHGPGLSLEDRKELRRRYRQRAIDQAKGLGDSMVCVQGEHSRCKGETPTGTGCLCKCHDRAAS